MTTAQKLKIASQLEVLLQIAIDRNWTTGSRLELMESIATLRSPRTVVLKFKEPGDPGPSELGKEYLVVTESDGWDVWNCEPNVLHDEARLYALLPDLGEIETEKGSGE